MVGGLAGNLGSLLNNAFLLFLIVCFILLEASPASRARSVTPSVTPRRWRTRMTEIGHVDPPLSRDQDAHQHADRRARLLRTGPARRQAFAPLWGLVAFLLNFVPAIGSVMAAIPAIALALVDNSLQTSAAVAAIYLGVNISIGNFLEPRALGEGMGLSPLIVVTSLIFWGWVLGPVGMVLAVPLTVILRITLDSQPQTHWVAILLGPAFPSPAVVMKERAERRREQEALSTESESKA